jgi:hypothetical protein
MQIRPLFFFFLLLTSFVSGQSFDRNVFAAAGREAKNPTFQLLNIRYMTYTIGEPIIHGASTPAYRLGNGFIQPAGISAVAPPVVTAISQLNDTYTVYPNPFNELLIIAAPEESIEVVKLQLIDQNGKLILETEMNEKQMQLSIPESCAVGIYWLNIYRLDGTFLQQNKLIKQIGAYSNASKY